jgi:hypothetical protein
MERSCAHRRVLISNILKGFYTQNYQLRQLLSSDGLTSILSHIAVSVTNNSGF